VLLSDVVAGRADVATLGLSDPDAIAATGVGVRLGTHAVRLDRDARQVVLDDGTALPYDDVVLATGSRAFVPRSPGCRPDCPACTRSARSTTAGRSSPRRRTRVVPSVLGGGLLGLEAARGLVRRGVDVTLLHAARTSWSGSSTRPPAPSSRFRCADSASRSAPASWSPGCAPAPTAAGRLARRGSTAGSAGGPTRGRRRRRSGEVPADLLVLACGVRPRRRLAQDAGLAVNRGVVVDDRSRAATRAVRAIGDCAGVRRRPGRPRRARVGAGARRRRPAQRPRSPAPAGAPATPSPGSRRPTSTSPRPARRSTDLWESMADGDVEVVQLADPGRGRYVKAVVRGGVVTGAVCVGAPRAAAELTLLVERGSPAPADRTALLLPGARTALADEGGDPTLIPDRATVCRCNGVTKGAIVGAWSDGARTVEGVAARTRATTGCGTCRDTVCGLLDWLTAADPDPDTSPVTARS
jgi:assimilatory nitrate reductase electron transfer subunit